jgi:glycosyltransferase involved in cell wall biosynthesis
LSLWIAAFLAAYMFVFCWKSRLQFTKLPRLAPAQPAAGSSTLVIVPCRNEAKNLARCLDSLQGQNILVVNDSSSDQTIQIAAQKNVAVVNAPPLLPGQNPKSSACLVGAKGATARWLLFVDADTWFEPGFVDAMVAHAEELRLDVMSAILRPHFGLPWEHAMFPFWQGVVFGSMSVKAIESVKQQQLLAYGQCILFRAEAYEFTGGHRIVVRNHADDIGIARVIKRHRLQYRLVRAEDLGHCKTGPGLWRAYKRTIFDFLSMNPTPVTMQVVVALLFMACWGPAVWFLWYEEFDFFAYAFAAIPTLATLVWYRNPLRAILAPAGIYLVLLATLHSLFTHIFGLSHAWKDRKI